MSKDKQIRVVLILLWVIALLPPMYYGFMQVWEYRIIDHYLSQNNLFGLPVSKETAVRVSDQVRNDFNTEESAFVALDMDDRPFLREDVGFLLTHKEGLCGEGTRVLVNLLDRLGFDATRITLFTKELEGSHTLLSVVVDEQEFFVDSINSTADLNELLRKNDLSSDDFDLLHYSDDIAKRRDFVGTDKNGRFASFFSYYWLYSYEATPYAKLLTKIGFDVRVFNFQRPNYWISIIAEKPNSVMFIVTFIASLLFMILVHKTKLVGRILQTKPIDGLP